MKTFKDFGIEAPQQMLVGDKIDIDRLVNREIKVIAFRIKDSKFAKKDEKCLHMQIEINDINYVVFTGGETLMTQISKVPKDEFPFLATIIKDNKRYEFK